MEQFAAGHQVGNSCGRATASGEWVNQTSISTHRIFLITKIRFLRKSPISGDAHGRGHRHEYQQQHHPFARRLGGVAILMATKPDLSP
jgi:hypothetical protein